MPDIEALIRYIDERRIKEDGLTGYSFVRGLPPTIRDTFFALSCLKMLEAESPDDEIVSLLSEYDQFDLNEAYYAMRCLKLTGAKVDFKEGELLWIYQGKEEQRPCAVPKTPLIHYFRHEIYGMYGSSIFSSSLSAVLRRVELGADRIDSSLVNLTIALLDLSNHQDIMRIYMALEILRAIERRGHPVTVPSDRIEQIAGFLKRCTTRKGYVGSPTSSSVTLESTYAGHRIAEYVRAPDPLGVASFIDSLQNDNGGFRGSQFGGISTLESCYLALSIIREMPHEGR
ncbi:MAG: hypothetical protein QUS08_09845 [Methanothrix sp.]|nr:hypothetical protein [Methanothrix sp.]